jgi:hypothetical protein
MESEIDVNILVNTFVQRIANLYKENTFLEAKYQSLLKEYNEILEVKNELQQELANTN